MKKLVMLFGLVAIFALAGQASYACSCVAIESVSVVDNGKSRVPTPEETQKWWREQQDHALFIGQVVKIEKVKVKQSDGDRVPLKKVTVKVNSYWVGARFISPEMIIYTGMGGGGSCAVSYMKDSYYFFPASRIQGLLRTSGCGSSEITDKLINDLDQTFGTAKEFSAIEAR